MPIAYDFKTGYPPADLIPRERLSAITARIIESGRGWQYGGDLQGKLPIREQVAHFLSDLSGVPVLPDQLMITNGALAGIDIACRTFTQPGDVVVVENPTFYYIVGQMKMSHVEVVGVPLASDGIDLTALAALADQYGERLKLVYSIPSFHNPTGINATNRAALAQLAAARDFIVLEDATYQPLYYGAPPPPLLKTYDTSGHVVTVASVSKVLMPSLRFGWLWAQPDQVRAFKQFKGDGAPSTFTAEIVADCIASGMFADQVEQARALYARKHERMVAALDRHAPPWLDWTAPGGGYFIWATLPEPLTAAQVLPLARERGVDLFRGSDCYVNPPARPRSAAVLRHARRRADRTGRRRPLRCARGCPRGRVANVVFVSPQPRVLGRGVGGEGLARPPLRLRRFLIRLPDAVFGRVDHVGTVPRFDRAAMLVDDVSRHQRLEQPHPRQQDAEVIQLS